MASKEMKETFKKFLDQNKEFSKLGSKEKDKVDTKQLSSMINKLPQYQETISKYSLHISMINDLLGNVKKGGKLEEVATQEQNMAVGEDGDGTKLKSNAVLSAVSTLLREDSIPYDIFFWYSLS